MTSMTIMQLILLGLLKRKKMKRKTSSLSSLADKKLTMVKVAQSKPEISNALTQLTKRVHIIINQMKLENTLKLNM